MFEELKVEIEKLKKDLDKVKSLSNIDKKIEQLKILESKTMDKHFWQNSSEAPKIMQEINRLKKEIDLNKKLTQQYEDIKTLFHLIREENDPSLVSEIKEEIERVSSMVKEIAVKTKLSDKFDSKNAIVSLHAGAGGTEACDWVDMLLRMYRKWADKKGYKITITDILAGEEAGIKSVTFVVEGEYAYGYLKSERGVHRLVRISPFDANKRRHTSFASCDVIPELDEEIKIVIDNKDLRIDTYRASGHGGQHVNKTDSAVRITHLPTGIVVQCQNERSQFKNKSFALKLLKARLYELEMEKKQKQQERMYDEKGDIAWGNQIRSYIFCPYTLVKDHRTNVEIGNVQAVMDGYIDPFIEGYLEKQKREVKSVK